MRSTPGPGLSFAKPAKGSKSSMALAPPKMRGKGSCAPLRSVRLIVFVSQLPLEGERGGKKKSKKRRRNSSMEAISGWEWERVSALMSSLAAWEGNRLLSV